VLGSLILWIGLTFSTRYVSVGSIAAAVAMPVLVAVTPHAGGNTLLWFSLGLAAVVVWAHRANIRRLARGKENRFARRGRSEEAA
jgi:glycerol-3-phosphate acyltransferase PlsY